MSGTWRLEGYDTFSAEDYPLGAYKNSGYDDGYQAAYPTHEAALADARRRLAELEVSQPSASSGGQTGVQDRVYIIHPDGYRQRVS